MTEGVKICPACGTEYKAPSALSRQDGKTHICPNCGIREALSTVGIPKNQQEEIIIAIHKCASQNEK